MFSVCVVLYAVTKTLRNGLLLFRKENELIDRLKEKSLELKSSIDDVDESGHDGGKCYMIGTLIENHILLHFQPNFADLDIVPSDSSTLGINLSQVFGVSFSIQSVAVLNFSPIFILFYPDQIHSINEQPCRLNALLSTLSSSNGFEAK